MIAKIHAAIPEKIRSKVYLTLIILLIILFICFVIRVIDAIQLRFATAQQGIPIVAVVKATQDDAIETLILPGNVQAWHAAPIYARTNGYIKIWFSDIGTSVKSGDVLAIIESPEVDAQLRQAEADLKTAETNNDLAQVTAKRWLNLWKTDSVSKQETDEKVIGAKASQTIVNARRANRDRLRDLVNFERVLAPFDGVITARLTDIGALINAGSNAQQRPLFRIAQADRLRIYVRVPQNQSMRIVPGMNVMLSFNEHPGKKFPAKLLQTADAIDRKTRTLLAQFIIDNSKRILLPGSYTQVHLELPPVKNRIILPVNTLLFRSEGLRVATLNVNGIVKLQAITISRDFGDTVEISAGIKVGDTIVINPPDSLIDGQKVETTKPMKITKDGKLA